jgi:phage FluMu protein Com
MWLSKVNKIYLKQKNPKCDVHNHYKKIHKNYTGDYNFWKA